MRSTPPTLPECTPSARWWGRSPPRCRSLPPTLSRPRRLAAPAASPRCAPATGIEAAQVARAYGVARLGEALAPARAVALVLALALGVGLAVARATRTGPPGAARARLGGAVLLDLAVDGDVEEVPLTGIQVARRLLALCLGGEDGVSAG